ncbi:MAG: hypothetical protein E6271_01395 [Negativicoccus succinicivorans]|uniref:hypothetical protein n=1 Tax=Negativicoccus succinicivorans TaxID=620903 RepID=UPI0029024D6A|nr:hypothetical protein [Negativicoccus succinicivorans]MDU2929073.1 hypothetical protein [Negativicoccus succinicivorans]MDU5027087.1 hypothetical protein [Negativicoccus succinicivorans]
MCKFIANALGFRAPRMPEIKQPAPTAQAVNVTDDTTGEEMAVENRRKKRGFLSTRSMGTILGSSDVAGKKTLG